MPSQCRPNASERHVARFEILDPQLASDYNSTSYANRPCHPGNTFALALRQRRCFPSLLLPTNFRASVAVWTGPLARRGYGLDRPESILVRLGHAPKKLADLGVRQVALTPLTENRMNRVVHSQIDPDRSTGAGLDSYQLAIPRTTSKTPERKDQLCGAGKP